MDGTMDEVDIQPVDLGLELWQRVQFRLAGTPVVVAGPVTGEFLDRGQRVLPMRRCRSAMASSGIFTRNGRISASSDISLHLASVG
jgi:hypothetical protein